MMKTMELEYKEKHPVVQSRNSGLWGFERVQDCVNLNRMIYRSKRAALLARARAAKTWAAMESDPERQGSRTWRAKYKVLENGELVRRSAQ